MEACNKHCTKPLDVHLMITHPEKYVERFCDAGAWSVGFHIEAVEDPMSQLREAGQGEFLLLQSFCSLSAFN